MRPILRLSVCGFAMMLAACDPEQVVETPDIPTAGIRFLNAVPDTGAMDFRFVDMPENSSHFAAAFRSTADFYYKPAQAGQRHLRVFRSSTDQAVASIVVKDTVLTLQDGVLYTVMLWGFARPGSDPGLRLTVIEDTAPDPGSEVALRVINACLPGVCGAAADGVLDVYQYPRGTSSGSSCPGGGTVPGTPSWSAVSALSVSSYVLAPPGVICFRATPSGAASVVADLRALLGSAATVDQEAIPGTTIAGSAVTAFILPRAVAGSEAGTVSTPTIIFNWDRRPSRTCSPVC